MGIQGLLPQLKPIQNPVSLIRYEGQTLGIDGYAWLHRAACCCAYELVTGQPTAKYLQFFIKKISMLRSFKIEPFFIFDGDSIGVKKETEAKRREKRVENKSVAERLWEIGEKSNAMDYFQKCVDVTPEMAKCIIDYCKTNKIQYIVAPFEADAQMVYLEKHNIIHGILSEDSDLLVFGCRRLITKMNDFGECIEICRDDFDKLPKKFPLYQLTNEEIRTMVCLSGCDYTSGIPKVGLITAMKLVRQFRTLDRILLSIQRDGKYKVPPNFNQETVFANFAFQFQRVFCPIKRKIVSLTEIPQDLRDCKELYESIGHVVHKHTGLKGCVMKDDDIDHDLHLRIAIGDLSPYNLQKRLVNREHKLQLSSKSELQVEHTAKRPQPRSIDSFFPRARTENKIPKITVLDKICTNRLPAVDKLDETIKKRKLNTDDLTVQTTSTTSKFFHQSTQPDEDDIETEVPSSQMPTQVSSVSTTQLDAEDDEVLSDLESDAKHSPAPAIARPARPRVLAPAIDSSMLQKFRYSGTREPLQSKNPNKMDRMVYVSSANAQPPFKRPQSARGIVVRAPSNPEPQQKHQSITRPAQRSLSLSSRFSYSASRS